MNDTVRYPRDMTGYGPTPPQANWPKGARIAVQFVLNYEEGGENNILHGDAASEAFLSEIVGAAQWPGQRHANMESMYEYGARAGFWRLHRMLNHLPVTVYGVATALARAPEQVKAMKEAGWEIASHGLLFILKLSVRGHAAGIQAVRPKTLFVLPHKKAGSNMWPTPMRMIFPIGPSLMRRIS